MWLWYTSFDWIYQRILEVLENVCVSVCVCARLVGVNVKGHWMFLPAFDFPQNSFCHPVIKQLFWTIIFSFLNFTFIYSDWATLYCFFRVFFKITFFFFQIINFSSFQCRNFGKKEDFVDKIMDAYFTNQRKHCSHVCVYPLPVSRYPSWVLDELNPSMKASFHLCTPSMSAHFSIIHGNLVYSLSALNTVIKPDFI